MPVPGGLVCALIVSTLATAQTPAGDAAEPASTASVTSRGSAGTAVLDKLVLAGDATDDLQEVVRGAILRGLGGEGVRVLEPPASGPPGPCTDASCAAAQAAAGRVDYVVGGKILVAERNYELTLELHDGRDGQIVATRDVSCPICSMPEVEAAAASAAAELAGQLRSKDSPLAITSCPSGALVYIDGALAGKTPLEQTLAPGEHQLEVKTDGYVDQARTIKVEAGVAPEVVAFSLLPKKTASGMAPLGWAMVGLGGLSVMTGAVLLALDERPFKAYCEGDNLDAAGRCRFQYNTLGGGVAGVVVGAALVGGGAALLVLDRKRRGSGNRAAAQLRLGVHPRGLTLSGRF